MRTHQRTILGACGLAMLLALGACDRSHEGGADRLTRNQTGSDTSRGAESSNDAAVRAAVQRAGSAQGS
jgi:hypothetical protein